MALTAGSYLGPYEVLAPLGTGGMGEVYRARDPRLGREVAIKVLPEAFSRDAERLARFGREARALAWIASASDDGLCLWPMPDVTQPPLHTLPYDELMAKLDALTNLRVVRDPTASSGWKLEVGPFPGWKEVPTW